jgi:ribonucleotide monophosphatase NagD (HAD superfamily)
VVVGFDGRHVRAVEDRLPLVSTVPGSSRRRTSPTGADGLWPGAGALLAVITTTTGAAPVIVGKPFAPVYETARRRGGG